VSLAQAQSAADSIASMVVFSLLLVSFCVVVAGHLPGSFGGFAATLSPGGKLFGLPPQGDTLRIITSRYCVVKVLSLPYLVPKALLATIRK
jgi:hypothetical protein